MSEEGNGQNQNHVKAVEEVGTVGNMQDAGEKILRDMLDASKLFCTPGVSSGGWCIVEVDVDGKKIPNAVLLIAQNNTVTTVWYNLQAMEDFVRNAAMALQQVGQATMANTPLIVANNDQMQQALQQKEQMDRSFGSKKDINWPPENGKFSL